MSTGWFPNPASARTASIRALGPTCAEKAALAQWRSFGWRSGPDEGPTAQAVGPSTYNLMGAMPSRR